MFNTGTNMVCYAHTVLFLEHCHFA